MKKTYEGDVKITKENHKEWEKKLEYIKIISGSVYISENATFQAPKLTEVSGYVDISENATFQAPKLTEVSGYVDIRENATFQAPKLTEVSGSVYISENATFQAPKLTEVSGSVYIRENATFQAPKLTEVSGSVYIRNGDKKLEKQLWKIASKNKWYVNDLSSDWLLSKKGNFTYKINDVELPKEWFDKICKDELTAEEVFAIDNIEHRRIAFEKMDKTKMKKLKDFKVLDEQIDGKSNKEKVLSFTVQNMKTPLKFYNCFCPSSKREYFIGTEKDDCKEAKLAIWGFNSKEIKFEDEW